MAEVEFRLSIKTSVPAETLWNALIDWAGHGEWIPATNVRVLRGDGGIGTEFVATTSFAGFALPDHMQVVAFDVVERKAMVQKLGPVLTGSAGFEVQSRSHGSVLIWHERVQHRQLPAILAPIAGLVGQLLFRVAIVRLLRKLKRK